MAEGGYAQSEPAVRSDREGRLYLHGMLAGYYEPDGSAVVDSELFGTEINWYLLARGETVRWENGVSKRLETSDIQAHLAPVQQVRVYQLTTQAPPGLLFADFAELTRAGLTVDPAHYKLVYEGACQGDLDDVYDALASTPPKGYIGRPLAVSDVLELCSGKLRGSYYIDHGRYIPLYSFSLPFTIKEEIYAGK